jgi:hypothetical protein
MVEEAAALLATSATDDSPERATLLLANLWVDYTLLARAVAEDTTLRHLPLDPVVETYLEQVVVRTLRDSVVEANGLIDEGDVARRYAAEAPDSEVRARQIRIDAPPAASQEARDRAAQTVASLRRRIVEEGESFEDVARAYSDDPASAHLGGDLGFFGPGDMVPEFYESVQALDVGEVSTPIETEYGYHLVRLEARRTPTREAFAERIRRQQRAAILDAYLDRLLDEAEPELRQGAPAVARQMAGGSMAMPMLDDLDTLVRFRGGSVTVEDLRVFMERQPPGVRAEIAQASVDDVVDDALMPMVRTRILVDRARRQGMAPTPDQVEAARAAFRSHLLETARQLELVPPSPGVEVDIGPAVREALSRMVRDDVDIASLGPAARALRTHYPNEVRPQWIGLVAERVAKHRREGGDVAPGR